MARADMESASPKRQSLQAARIELPAELSASSSVDLPLGAMMSDQSLCKLRSGETVMRAYFMFMDQSFMPAV